MSEKQILAITGGILGVILLLGGGGVYVINSRTIKAREKEIDKVKGEVKTAQTKAKKLLVDPKTPGSSMGEKLTERKARSASLEGRVVNFSGTELPGEPIVDLEYDRFFDLLERFRRHSGIAIGSARWLVPKKLTGAAAARAPKLPAGLHRADYEIICAGSFYQLLRFLNLLETSGRFVNVESFQITAGKSVGVSAHGMRVLIYTFAFQTPAAKTEPPKKDVTTPMTSSPTSREFPE